MGKFTTFDRWRQRLQGGTDERDYGELKAARILDIDGIRRVSVGVQFKAISSLEPDVLGSRSEFKILAGETSIDPRTSGELCIERAMSR